CAWTMRVNSRKNSFLRNGANSVGLVCAVVRVCVVVVVCVVFLVWVFVVLVWGGSHQMPDSVFFGDLIACPFALKRSKLLKPLVETAFERHFVARQQPYFPQGVGRQVGSDGSVVGIEQPGFDNDGAAQSPSRRYHPVHHENLQLSHRGEPRLDASGEGREILLALAFDQEFARQEA